MIVVAFSAFVVWAGITGKQLRSKAQRYRALATQHTAREATARAKFTRLVALRNNIDIEIAKTDARGEVLKLMRRAREELPSELDTTKVEVDREAALRQSFDRIARHPWLPSPPGG